MPAAASLKPKNPIGFLDLPGEVRNQIFGLVCGGGMIHVRERPDSVRYQPYEGVKRYQPSEAAKRYRPVGDFSRYQPFEAAYDVCRAFRTDDESFEGFWSPKMTGEKTWDKSDHDICKGGNEKALDLALLRVSKQVSREAGYFAYENKIFSFADYDDYGSYSGRGLIKGFVANMRPEPLARIRKLRLGMRMVGTHAEACWQKEVCDYILPHMPNIDSIHLFVDAGAARCWTQPYKDSGKVQELSWMKPILALRALPLKTVEIVIADADSRIAFNAVMAVPGSPLCHQTLCKGNAAHRSQLSYSSRRTIMQEYAEYLRKKLLETQERKRDARGRFRKA